MIDFKIVENGYIRITNFPDKELIQIEHIANITNSPIIINYDEYESLLKCINDIDDLIELSEQRDLILCDINIKQEELNKINSKINAIHNKRFT